MNRLILFLVIALTAFKSFGQVDGSHILDSNILKMLMADTSAPEGKTRPFDYNWGHNYIIVRHRNDDFSKFLREHFIKDKDSSTGYYLSQDSSSFILFGKTYKAIDSFPLKNDSVNYKWPLHLAYLKINLALKHYNETSRQLDTTWFDLANFNHRTSSSTLARKEEANVYRYFIPACAETSGQICGVKFQTNTVLPFGIGGAIDRKAFEYYTDASSLSEERSFDVSITSTPSNCLIYKVPQYEFDSITTFDALRNIPYTGKRINADIQHLLSHYIVVEGRTDNVIPLNETNYVVFILDGTVLSPGLPLIPGPGRPNKINWVFQ